MCRSNHDLGNGPRSVVRTGPLAVRSLNLLYWTSSPQRSLHEVKALQILTADGYEIQFGTNHISLALLIKFLLPTLAYTTSLPGVTDVRTAQHDQCGLPLLTP